MHFVGADQLHGFDERDHEHWARYEQDPAPEWRQAPTDQTTNHVLPEGVADNAWVEDNIID